MGDVQVLHAGLALLAARFVLPGRGPEVAQAIKLACELLACGLDTPATVDVAAMRYGTPLRDAGSLLREMLDEQSFGPYRHIAGYLCTGADCFTGATIVNAALPCSATVRQGDGMTAGQLRRG